jgi:hypothetical protein
MTLEEARGHIGDAVVYDNGSTRWDGTIVRVGQQFVFVRYGHNDVSIAATPPDRLTLLGSSFRTQRPGGRP